MEKRFTIGEDTMIYNIGFHLFLSVLCPAIFLATLRNMQSWITVILSIIVFGSIEAAILYRFIRRIKLFRIDLAKENQADERNSGCNYR